PRLFYRVGVPLPGGWRELLNTDSGLYGGGNLGNSGFLRSEPVPSHGEAQSLELLVPPLATLMLRHES
ncbi:MAG: alpha amylase C-terminal domain-containing protein, partial [Hyphomicrobiales bacterium]|nr:alpha amylase C-terminal domain-containing protein [Hyphomicrobiales bacterium]